MRFVRVINNHITTITSQDISVFQSVQHKVDHIQQNELFLEVVVRFFSYCHYGKW